LKNKNKKIKYVENRLKKLNLWRSTYSNYIDQLEELIKKKYLNKYLYNKDKLKLRKKMQRLKILRKLYLLKVNKKIKYIECNYLDHVYPNPL